MINKKNMILSYKRLYSKKKYCFDDALLLFNNLKFLTIFHNINISIKLKLKKKIFFVIPILINGNIIQKNISSDKFGLINVNIGNINMDYKDLSYNYINLFNKIKEIIQINNIKYSHINIFLDFSGVFSIFLLLDL